VPTYSLDELLSRTIALTVKPNKIAVKVNSGSELEPFPEAKNQPRKILDNK
jgi:hypothetical protein